MRRGAWSSPAHATRPPRHMRHQSLLLGGDFAKRRRTHIMQRLPVRFGGLQELFGLGCPTILAGVVGQQHRVRFGSLGLEHVRLDHPGMLHGASDGLVVAFGDRVVGRSCVVGRFGHRIGSSSFAASSQGEGVVKRKQVATHPQANGQDAVAAAFGLSEQDALAAMTRLCRLGYYVVPASAMPAEGG